MQLLLRLRKVQLRLGISGGTGHTKRKRKHISMDCRFVVVLVLVLAFCPESSTFIFFHHKKLVNPLKTCQIPQPIEVCSAGFPRHRGGCSDRDKVIEDVLAKPRKTLKVTLVALMDAYCFYVSPLQATKLRWLRKSLANTNVTAEFMIIDRARFLKRRKALVAKAGNIPIYYSDKAFDTLGGRRDDVFIFDCNGRLRYHMKHPDSFDTNKIKTNLIAAQDCTHCN